MKTNAVTPTNFQSGVKIRAAENKSHKFLYNEVLELTRKQGLPANFRTHEIELPSVTIDIMKMINSLKIKFYSGKKH